jgi:hypothetical protein
MNENQAKIAEAVSLILEAMKAKQENNGGQVQVLMDEAIGILEDAIGKNPQLEITRELLVLDYYSEDKKNWSNLGAIIEKARAYYTQQDILPMQVSMLIQYVHLAIKLGEKDEATLTLSKLKKQLDTITAEEINKKLPPGIIAPTGDDLLQKWREEVRCLEQMVVEME